MFIWEDIYFLCFANSMDLLKQELWSNLSVLKTEHHWENRPGSHFFYEVLIIVYFCLQMIVGRLFWKKFKNWVFQNISTRSSNRIKIPRIHDSTFHLTILNRLFIKYSAFIEYWKFMRVSLKIERLGIFQF